MSKAEEFERLAKSAAQGEWTDKPAEPLRYQDGPAKGFPRYTTVAGVPPDIKIVRCDETSPEGGWSPYFTAQFVMWCANNRELIARALRRDAEIERIYNSVHAGEDYSTPSAAIAAFREAVK